MGGLLIIFDRHLFQLGLLCSLVLLFGNKMLLTSWLSCSLFASAAILNWKKIPVILKKLLGKGLSFGVLP